MSEEGPAALGFDRTGELATGMPKADPELRIAAYLSVKDESEIIAHTIAHLRAIGIDYIIACDISSTDGTTDLLRAYESDDFKLVTMSDAAVGSQAPTDETWFEQSFKQFRDAPADWIIFLDADEFWLPASGNLKACSALRVADIVTVKRLNIVLGPEGPLMPRALTPQHYGEVLLYAGTIANNRQKMKTGDNDSWIRGAVMPKIMARKGKIRGLTPGMHDAVVPKGDNIRRAVADDLLIAHLPLSTIERFAVKVNNVREIYEREGIDLSSAGETWEENGTAWHWRRWAGIRSRSALAQEFGSNVLMPERMTELLRAGVVRSAYNMLASAALGDGRP
jgi:hypothetical protein